jgi:6,7-dimethyl-8-ribityllumazine synthase
MCRAPADLPVPTLSGELRVNEKTRFAIIASRWNPRIVDALIDGARRAFVAHGVSDDAVDVVRVPGAWEIPVVAEKLALADRYVAILALGCVVRGDTRHYEHVADGCAQGLMRVALDHGVPVLNGVLAVERHADAEARAGGTHGNKGEDVALAAIEIVDLCAKFDSADKDGRFLTLAIKDDRKGKL